PPCFAVFDDAPAIRLTPPKLLPDNDTVTRLRWDVRPRCLAVRTDENDRVRGDAAVANTRCREPLAERSPHLVLGLRHADAGVGATLGFGWLRSRRRDRGSRDATGDGPVGRPVSDDRCRKRDGWRE